MLFPPLSHHSHRRGGFQKCRVELRTSTCTSCPSPRQKKPSPPHSPPTPPHTHHETWMRWCDDVIMMWWYDEMMSSGCDYLWEGGWVLNPLPHHPLHHLISLVVAQFVGHYHPSIHPNIHKKKRGEKWEWEIWLLNPSPGCQSRCPWRPRRHQQTRRQPQREWPWRAWRTRCGKGGGTRGDWKSPFFHNNQKKERVVMDSRASRVKLNRSW